jgi:hypothetical protein
VMLHMQNTKRRLIDFNVHAKAVTIAARYSCVRQQGFRDGRPSRGR